MSTATLSERPKRLPESPCPNCGMPAPSAIAELPSGRKLLIEACAICGRQEATPVDAQRASELLCAAGRA